LTSVSTGGHSMNRLRLCALTIAASAALAAACDRDPPPRGDLAVAPPAELAPSGQADAFEPAMSATSNAPSEIAWFGDGIDEAFVAAETSGKPVLLYWGAAWCPYCADLEAHVFTREDFKRKLELFVPVY